MSEERNREVDAAWRAASNEEPPPTLDAAIRAEARRAVAAGVKEARRRRYRQLRYPFAAAATVALLAFGIAEMTPPERFAPTIVSDQPAAPRDRAQKPQLPAAPQPEQAPANVPAPAQAPPSLTSVPPAAESGAAIQRERSLDAPAKKDASRKETPAPGFAQSSPASSGATDLVAPNVAENPPKSEPFPAVTSGRSGKAPPENATSARPPLGRRDAFAEAPKQPEESVAGGPARKLEESAPASPAGALERRAAAAPSAAVSKVSSADESKAKQAGVESVEAWIARIRELESSGQAAAAAIELAKFRATYGERADALLAADLRSVVPSRP